MRNFSRNVDGVRQDIQVVLDRYADEVCARYGTSRRIDLTMQKRRVREFMARECPWHRPEDIEWISFDGGNIKKLNRSGQNQLPSIDMPSSMSYT